MCKAMVQRTGPHLLLLIALCSVLYSQALSLPYKSMRMSEDGEDMFTSAYSKLLRQLAAKKYFESLTRSETPSTSKITDDLMEEPMKRHTDGIFTDSYSRFRKQMAAKKYLESLINGKRSLEEPAISKPEMANDDPNTFQETYDDINVDNLLNNFQLPL